MKAKFNHSEKITHNITTFWFEPEKKLNYLAGQYSDVTINGLTHTYTLSSSPTEDLIGLSTKFNEPVSQFKSGLQSLKKGDEIIIKEAMGDYVLPKDSSIPLIFVSGGIGITPARSIIKYLIDTNQKRDIQLLYAVNTEKDLAFDNLFKSANFVKYVTIISKPLEKINSETGKLDTNKVKALAKISDNSMVFVSGPQVMVETICYELAESINRNQIIMDYFEGYADI